MQVRERLVANALKMSVRTRFQSMISARVEAHAQSGQVEEDGQARMSVDDCIDVVNELVEEVHFNHTHTHIHTHTYTHTHFSPFGTF
jgi:hypothetical protein